MILVKVYLILTDRAYTFIVAYVRLIIINRYTLITQGAIFRMLLFKSKMTFITFITVPIWLNAKIVNLYRFTF